MNNETYNPRAYFVYAKLNELSQEIQQDTFSLTEGERNILQIKIDEINGLLNQFYSSGNKE